MADSTPYEVINHYLANHPSAKGIRQSWGFSAPSDVLEDDWKFMTGYDDNNQFWSDQSMNDERWDMMMNYNYDPANPAVPNSNHPTTETLTDRSQLGMWGNQDGISIISPLDNATVEFNGGTIPNVYGGTNRTSNMLDECVVVGTNKQAGTKNADGSFRGKTSFGLGLADMTEAEKKMQESMQELAEELNAKNGIHIYAGHENPYSPIGGGVSTNVMTESAKSSGPEWAIGKKLQTEQVDNSILDFDLPRWGIADYIQERTNWQKQLDSMTGDPGLFYFKVFFKFNTNFGLLGGLLKDGSGAAFNSANTALKYLLVSRKLYKQEKIMDRILALYKFISILSFISSKTPWFFQSIRGLDKANGVYINKFEEEKSIEIGCMEDAIDMRLNTMMDLYKYACYDDINCKEIIPENLRKFEMSVVVFHAPLKYYHTGIQSRKYGKIPYKSLNGGTNTAIDFANMMSYKMFTFSNCEFALDGLGNLMPNEISNEKGANLGKTSIKITYDRVYKHTMNEWYEFMFGADGFYYNENIDGNELGYDNKNKRNYNGAEGYKMDIGSNRSQKKRINAIKAAIDRITEIESSNKYNTKQGQRELIDNVEYLITDSLKSVDKNMILGNLYGDVGVSSDYWKAKMEHDRGLDHYLGNLYNMDLGPGTEYFVRKMQGWASWDNYYEQLNYGVPNPAKLASCDFMHLDPETIGQLYHDYKEVNLNNYFGANDIITMD